MSHHANLAYCIPFKSSNADYSSNNINAIAE